jgi:hypothetical protein
MMLLGGDGTQPFGSVVRFFMPSFVDGVAEERSERAVSVRARNEKHA